jgi:hypothetical protein
MNTKKLVLATLLTCLFATAWADEPSAPSSFVPASVPPGKQVKNAPYSAESIQETLRNLPDGNQIVTKVSAMHYRDSQGNTRDESRAPSGDVQSVTIHSAADNSSYNLAPLAKMAIKINSDKIGAKAAAYGKAIGLAARAQRETRRKEGKPQEIDEKDMAAVNEIVVKRAPPVGDVPMNIAPMLIAAINERKWSSKPTVKELGARNIDGIRAEGKLRSYEIPAGEVGNRKPIVVSDETWYSPELQITLYSKHSDVRSGDVIYRLTNLKRGEPAAGLFTVPSDYTVNDITDAILKGM